MCADEDDSSFRDPSFSERDKLKLLQIIQWHSKDKTTYWEKCYSMISLVASVYELPPYEVALPDSDSHIQEAFTTLSQKSWMLPKFTSKTNLLRATLVRGIQKKFVEVTKEHKKATGVELLPWDAFINVWTRTAKFFYYYWILNPDLTKVEAHDAVCDLGKNRVTKRSHLDITISEVLRKTKNKKHLEMVSNLRKITITADEGLPGPEKEYYMFAKEELAFETIRHLLDSYNFRHSQYNSVLAAARKWLSTMATAEEKKALSFLEITLSKEEVNPVSKKEISDMESTGGEPLSEDSTDDTKTTETEEVDPHKKEESKETNPTEKGDSTETQFPQPEESSKTKDTQNDESTETKHPVDAIQMETITKCPDGLSTIQSPPNDEHTKTKPPVDVVHFESITKCPHELKDELPVITSPVQDPQICSPLTPMSKSVITFANSISSIVSSPGLQNYQGCTWLEEYVVLMNCVNNAIARGVLSVEGSRPLLCIGTDSLITHFAETHVNVCIALSMIALGMQHFIPGEHCLHEFRNALFRLLPQLYLNQVSLHLEAFHMLCVCNEPPISRFWEWLTSKRTDPEIVVLTQLKCRLVHYNSLFEAGGIKLPAVRGLLEEEKELLHGYFLPEEQHGDTGCNIGFTDNYPISIRSFQTLKPSVWLNDEVINAYFSLTTKQESRANQQDVNGGQGSNHFLNSYFMKLFTSQGGADYELVRHCFIPGGNPFLYSGLLIPINIDDSHWQLIVVSLKARCIQFYDSMNGDGDEDVQNVLYYLQNKYKELYRGELETEGWHLSGKTPAGLPLQPNLSDCGVYCCAYADFALKGLQVPSNQEELDLRRQHIAITIAKGMSPCPPPPGYRKLTPVPKRRKVDPEESVE